MMAGTHRIIVGDVLAGLATLGDGAVHTCVTSPPYWGLRRYGNDPAELGQEATPEAYIARLVEIFREVRRTLRDDGTLWVNIGDCYSSGGRATFGTFTPESKQASNPAITSAPRAAQPPGIKPKDLIGVPWMLAFALRADGWYLRGDHIWCLSGGTWLYVRTDDGGICLMTVKDLRRLKPETVRLWNGKEWTRLLGMSRSKRRGDELEITLRSGERIACTPTHRFPLYGGFPIKAASELKAGDRLERCRLPEPQYHLDTPEIGEDAAWLCGLYVAEGSRSGDTIQIAGHAKEQHRWDRLRWIAHKYGGSATRTVSGNRMDIRLYGKILNGIIDQFVSGKTAHDKGFAPPVWRCGNNFIRAMIDGYLAGDGHHDIKNDRWRLGFCRNYNLERDLRTACARLGYRLTLNLSSVRYKGRDVPTFKGEIRTHTREHPNCKDPNEIVSIGKARCREVYDLGVADEPHLFALASGILTHNSKPNPMPESVTDRPTKAHEYVFLLSKSERYHYDRMAVRTAPKASTITRLAQDIDGQVGSVRANGGERPQRPMKTVRSSDKQRGHSRRHDGFNDRWDAMEREEQMAEGANLRSVWWIPPAQFKEAHFAVMPERVAEICIRAGCPVGGTVLDPFAGSGTVGAVACPLGRNFIGCELYPDYAAMAERRIGKSLNPGTFRDDRPAESPLFGAHT